MLYRLAGNKLSVVPTEDYFNPINTHSYWLYLASAKETDVAISRETRTLDRDTRRIFHDLTKEGHQEVGTLRARKIEETQRFNLRGFVRILYKTKEGGVVQEAYILCDLDRSSLTTREFETEVEAFEDAPHKLMDQPGYIMRDDVFLRR